MLNRWGTTADMFAKKYNISESISYVKRHTRDDVVDEVVHSAIVPCPIEPEVFNALQTVVEDMRVLVKDISVKVTPFYNSAIQHTGMSVLLRREILRQETDSSLTRLFTVRENFFTCYYCIYLILF
jgi:hypothetical protein